MAELTADQKRIKELEAKLGARDQELAQKRVELAAKVKTINIAAQTGKISPVVEGSFLAKWKDDVTGKDASRKVEFKNGRVRVYMKSSEEVSSEAIIRIANGGKATETELMQFPVLNTVTKEVAADLLIHYAKMGAGFLK